MKTKAEIVQELLDKNQITAEDAVVLLMGMKEYVYVPTYPAAPYRAFPWTPGVPYWYANPFPAYCSTAADVAQPATATLTFRLSSQ